MLRRLGVYEGSGGWLRRRPLNVLRLRLLLGLAWELSGSPAPPAAVFHPVPAVTKTT